MSLDSSVAPLKVLGRYALHEAIAMGGMATVHLGRLLGPVGFARTVAIKRLHESLAQDPAFTSMFVDEARLAARIRHPNVVPTLDVVAVKGELFLVMDYVQGESLARLFANARQQDKPIPIAILRTVVAGVLHGLHAAHEATDGHGKPLDIIHRDVSPQNILVGVDGVPRVLDFGVAKAAGRVQTTRDGQLKGKLAYMAPEQLRGEGISRAVDIFASGILLWEGLANRPLFSGDSEGELVVKVLDGAKEPPSQYRAEVPPELDAMVVKALSPDPAQRFATAREMARALEKLGPLVPASEIGEWVEEVAGRTLAERASKIARIEGTSSVSLQAVDSSSSRLEMPRGVEVTQTTSSTSMIFTLSNNRMRLVVGSLSLLAFIGVALIALAIGRPSSKPAPALGASVTVTSPNAPEVSADPDPAPTPFAAATASAPSTASTSTVTSNKPVPSPRPPTTTRVQSPRSGCDPPWVIDGQGNRRYKRECLK